MKRTAIVWFILALVIAGIIAVVAIAGCIGDEDGSGEDTYCCRYEVRSTGCGGKGWSDWKAELQTFNINDYKEGWTPAKVCDKYTGSTTTCGGGCCIFVEYRNNRLSQGSCP